MSDVGFARDGGVATITLDRPADQNRLTRPVLLANPVVRASYSKEQILELVRLANRVYDALETLPQIVIAALNGATRAGAAELSLACDIRLAAAHATFALPEALWGGCRCSSAGRELDEPGHRRGRGRAPRGTDATVHRPLIP